MPDSLRFERARDAGKRSCKTVMEFGTFTTFSTFAADAVGLAGTRVGSRRGRSVGHVVNTLVLGVGAAALGLTIS